MRFAIIFLALFGLTSWGQAVEHLREPYCELLAWSLGVFFNAVGFAASQNGPTIYGGQGGITVIPSCDGLVLLCLFIAGVGSTPLRPTITPYLRALGYLAALVGINWLRLAILTYAGFNRWAIFDVLHHYVLQTVLVLCVVGLYLLWLRSLAGDDDDGAPSDGEAIEEPSDGQFQAQH